MNLLQYLKEQGADKKTLRRVRDLYAEIDDIFEEQTEIEKNDGCFSHEKLVHWDDRLHEIEFELQEIAGFKKDITWHTRWFNQPCCTCSIMDNYELVGVNAMIIDANCPIHGDIDKGVDTDEQ